MMAGKNAKILDGKYVSAWGGKSSTRSTKEPNSDDRDDFARHSIRWPVHRSNLLAVSHQPIRQKGSNVRHLDHPRDQCSRGNRDNNLLALVDRQAVCRGRCGLHSSHSSRLHRRTFAKPAERVFDQRIHLVRPCQLLARHFVPLIVLSPTYSAGSLSGNLSRRSSCEKWLPTIL